MRSDISDRIDNLTKTNIIEHVALRCGVPKIIAAAIVSEVFENIIQHFENGGQSVSIRGFGVFTFRVREPFTTADPNDPEKSINVPSKNIVSLKSSREFNSRIN